MPRFASELALFRYVNSPPEIIRLVIKMYFWFPLSVRDVEGLLAGREPAYSGTVSFAHS